MKRLSLSVFIVLLFVGQQLLAQTPPAGSQQKPSVKTAPVTAGYTPDTVKNTDPSLGGQYRFLLSRSKSINGYKLINPYRLSGFYKSVTDTLAKERVELNKLKKEVSAQAEELSQLQSSVKENETAATNTTAKINEINLLGLTFTKDTYNIIVWSVIALLALALVLVIKRSGSSIADAKDKSEQYGALAAEFQEYKTKAKEKERKLARELQDERNIIEELQQNKKK